ncbi:endonuclease III domain-containing protein [Virgibacillus siamensis]|uniref:endonuclease III domain-containing protein n=1 Tax=Virgibacillus siamensis TaxID=480071 RepID=UPI000985DE09|nr:endonuclease [Virgibacillus siamensis]
MQDFDWMYRSLYEYYGPQHWWPAETVFEMLIGAILVQNTSWRNVEKAIIKVKPYMEPELMYHLQEWKLAELIQSSGFFNIKAKRIKAFLEWFKRYDFDVRQIRELDGIRIREELLDIKGIGRETADVMLVYAFEKPVFVADGYARRIFDRYGFDMPAAYDDFRRQVEARMTYELHVFKEFHALLVEHAKSYCKKRPICGTCPLQHNCMQRIT